MSLKIEKVAVLGGGVMGSGIAAHIAGAGIPVDLLDIVPRDLTEEERSSGLTTKSPRFRNRFSLKGVETALAARPDAFFDKKDARLIRCGNYEDDIDRLKEADWIVEVVVENLDIKKKVFAMVAKHRKPGCIVTSNTSGLYVRDMVDGMPDEMRRNFFVTHFFNPVRYMHLLEVVAGKDTDASLLEEFSAWSERVLGKGIVIGKDTPNFVANRIGVHGMLALMHVMEEMGLTVPQVDKILGPATGRPKSAAFRTLDMVGLDTFIHVANNVYEGAPEDEERDVFKPHRVFHELQSKGWLGDKTGGVGFYRVVRSPEGKKEIMALDLKTLTHVPQEKVRFPSLGKAKEIDDPGERIRTIVESDDLAGKFAWKVLSRGLVYSCRRIPEIADDIVNIDNALKWGFAWELGPFETWDALGVAKVAARLEAEGREVPALAREVLAKGEGSFYVSKAGILHYWDTASKKYLPVKTPKGSIFLRTLKETGKVVKKVSSANLLDLGDGVLLVEFTGKMNALDTDVFQLFEAADKLKTDGFKGLVIGNEGKQAFSAGANLFLIFTTIAQKQWDILEKLSKGMQDTLMALQHGPFPVVVAPHSLTLGGGCEVTMHGTAVQAAAETYIGLVEVGVGLIPGGGGCKEMLFRKRDLCEKKGPKGPFAFVQQAFEAIATVKIATSGKQAKAWGYLRPEDGISLNRDYLIADAKQKVLELAKTHKPVEMRKIKLPGEGGRTALEYGVAQMRLRNLVTEYEETMACRLARVLTGGNTHPTIEMTEQQVLDIEREVFMSLAGEQKTAERIQHMLMNNKPLRN